MFDGLKDVADLLDQKAPDDAQGFKKAMLLVGVNIARSSGGGIFRDSISEEEKIALVAVFAALRVRPE